MKNYAVIQHNYSEFLGLIEGLLEVRDIGFSYVRPFVGQELPGSPLHYDALFMLGGSEPPAGERAYPWLAQEIALIDRFLQAGRPVLGIGLGAQLVAQWAGGAASAEPLHSAYWTTAQATAEGRSDPLAQAVDGRKVLVIYNGAVELPSSLKPIVVDEQGRWLAVRPRPLVYGLLFRPELKPGMIEDMVMEAGRQTPENIGEVLAQARREWGQTQHTTQHVIMALTTALDLMKERKKAPVFRLKVEDDDG